MPALLIVECYILSYILSALLFYTYITRTAQPDPYQGAG